MLPQTVRREETFHFTRWAAFSKIVGIRSTWYTCSYCTPNMETKFLGTSEKYANTLICPFSVLIHTVVHSSSYLFVRLCMYPIVHLSFHSFTHQSFYSSIDPPINQISLSCISPLFHVSIHPLLPISLRTVLPLMDISIL